MKKIIRILLFEILLCVWIAGYALCSNLTPVSDHEKNEIDPKEKKQITDQNRTVVLERVKKVNIDRTIHYPGTIRACKHANLAFRVGGPLLEVKVKTGDKVKKGVILMQIDPQDYKDRINVLDAQLDGALSRLKTAQSDFTRTRTLYDQKVIAEADFDHAFNALQMADADVSYIRAQLLIARRQLDYTSLKAPYDAIITSRNIENYEIVTPGMPVISLHDISMLDIEVNIPENQIVRLPLKAGVQAQVKLISIENKNFQAKLKEWTTAADPAGKTFALIFTMPMPESTLILPGMTAELILNDTSEKKIYITVPSKAVITDSSGNSFVWVFNVQEARALKRKVETKDFSGDSDIIITKGLKGVESIVIDGMDFITENMHLVAVYKN